MVITYMYLRNNIVVYVRATLQIKHEPEHGYLVLIAYAQKSPFNDKKGVSSTARRLNFGMSLQLYLYFVYESSEGSNESAHLCRLA